METLINHLNANNLINQFLVFFFVKCFDYMFPRIISRIRKGKIIFLKKQFFLLIIQKIEFEKNFFENYKQSLIEF